MILLAAIGPAILCAAFAVWMRSPLRRLSFIVWIGWTLLGAGLPVLAGQLYALAVMSAQPDGLVGAQAAEQVRLGLAAGLSGGFGWVAGAVSARLTAPRD
jgi:sugar phosphate permease